MLVKVLDKGERCGLADASCQRSDVRVGFVSEDVVVVLYRVSGGDEPGGEGRVGIVNENLVLLGLPRVVLDWHVGNEPAVVADVATTLPSVTGDGGPHVSAWAVENLPGFV